MANIPILRFDPPRRSDALDNAAGNAPPQPGILSVTSAGALGLPVGIAIILALLGAIHPFVSSYVAEWRQTRQEEVRVRRERAVDEAAWLRSVLALDDDTRRETAFKFLLKARLVDDPDGTLQKLAAKDIPFIHREAPGPKQEIKAGQPLQPH